MGALYLSSQSSVGKPHPGFEDVPVQQCLRQSQAEVSEFRAGVEIAPKMSLVESGYYVVRLSNLGKTGSAQESKKPASSPAALLDITFEARSAEYAKDLSSDLLDEMQHEVQVQKEIQSAIKRTLGQYNKPGAFVDAEDLERAKAKLLDARGVYLARAGREAMRAVQPLVELVQDRKDKRLTLHQWERDRVLAETKPENRFANLESRFRDLLLEKQVHSKSSLGDRLFKEAVEKPAHREKKD